MSGPAGGSHPAGDSLTQRAIAAVLRAVLRATVQRAFRAGLPVERQRRRLLRMARLTRPPRDATFEPGICGGIPGEWFRARAPEPTAPTFLYLHGGGYCTGSPATHRAVTGHLAVRCAARVFAPDYRLAPEHPFPSAVDDAAAAYRGLLGEGVASGDIVIAGDSAGGGLAVAVTLRLRELGQSLPRALVLFSPWVDLTLEHLGPAPPGEVMLTLPWIGECARAYVGGSDPHHPLVSPVGADLHGLPPTLIQVGSDELLLPDSRRLFERLRMAEVPAVLQEYPARWHVFQVNAGMLADADRALDEVARYVREIRLDGRQAAPLDG